MTDTLKAVAPEEWERYQLWLKSGVYADPARRVIAKLAEAVEERDKRWAELPQAMATHMVAAYEWDCDAAGWAEEFEDALRARAEAEKNEPFQCPKCGAWTKQNDGHFCAETEKEEKP